MTVAVPGWCPVSLTRGVIAATTRGDTKGNDMSAAAFRTVSTFAAALFMSGMLISAATSLPPLV